MTFLVHTEPVAALLGPSTQSRVRIRGPQSSGGSRSQSRTCEVSPPLTSPGSLGPQASETRGRAGNYTGGLCWSDRNGQPLKRRPRLPSPGARIRPAAAGNEWVPEPPPRASPHPGAAAPQPATPGVQGGRPALTVRASSARLGSSSFSTPVSAAEPQSERSSVRKGPLHFLPPAAAAAGARPEPPHPLVLGSPLRTGRGRRGGGQRPWLESGRRRDLGDAAQGGACSEM